MNSIYRLYSSLPCPPAPHTAAEISIPALINNYRLLLEHARKNMPDVRAISVVKAEAYGHGADAVALALNRVGCDFFAVSCIDEAKALRHSLGSLPDILILGYTDPSRAHELADENIIQTIFSREYMTALDYSSVRSGVRVRTHLKLDTGMNRIGFPAQSDAEISAAADAAADLTACPGLIFEGLFTHFARADENYMVNDNGVDTSSTIQNNISGEIKASESKRHKIVIQDKAFPVFNKQNSSDDTCLSKVPDCSLSGEEFTELQFARYSAVAELIEKRSMKISCRHVCNSAAAVRHPEYRLDYVRFGIMLYGLLPSDLIDFPGLLPVMKLRTIVTHVHDLLPGESVGYGGCFTSSTPRRIATLPVGYADGFIRAYTGGTIKIYHDGKAYPVKIVGRICMDQLTADITDTPCEAGDAAVLFGDETGDLELLARQASTIGYEALTLISSRVPRYYIN